MSVVEPSTSKELGGIYALSNIYCDDSQGLISETQYYYDGRESHKPVYKSRILTVSQKIPTINNPQNVKYKHLQYVDGDSNPPMPIIQLGEDCFVRATQYFLINGKIYSNKISSNSCDSEMVVVGAHAGDYVSVNTIAFAAGMPDYSHRILELYKTYDGEVTEDTQAISAWGTF